MLVEYVVTGVLCEWENVNQAAQVFISLLVFQVSKGIYMQEASQNADLDVEPWCLILMSYSYSHFVLINSFQRLLFCNKGFFFCLFLFVQGDNLARLNL